jgi:hypothetical protein
MFAGSSENKNDNTRFLKYREGYCSEQNKKYILPKVHDKNKNQKTQHYD